MKYLFIPTKLEVLAIKQGIQSIVIKYNGEYIQGILYQQIVDWFREEHKLEIQVLILKHTFKSITSYKHSLRAYEEHSYYKALDKAIEEAFKLI